MGDQEHFPDKVVEGLQDLRAARQIFFAVLVDADLHLHALELSDDDGDRRPEFVGDA